MQGLPKTIYKYRTWSNENHRTILTEQEVFLSRPTSFEDPLDCKLLKRYDLITNQQIYDKYLTASKEDHPNWTRQQHRKFARDWFKKSPMHNKEYINQLQEEHFKEFDSRFGVLSLTANQSNFIMWDKYSEHHKGFCVGFNSLRMFPYLGGGGPVKYYEKLPDILPLDDYQDEHYKQVFSKENKWEFEEEYRTHKFFERPMLDEERKIKLPIDCFTEIIFGVQMQNDVKDEITNICEMNKMKITFFEEIVDFDNESVSISKKVTSPVSINMSV